jgi:hypothetical protein
MERQHLALNVAGRAGNDRIGIGNVEHDERLEIGTGPGLLQREAAARAIANRRILCGIDETELSPGALSTAAAATASSTLVFS